MIFDSPYKDVRFSREYAVLLMRYMHNYSSLVPYPSTLDSDDIDTLNRLAHKLIKYPNCTHFGLAIGANLHICDYGSIGYAAMNCPTLLDALTTTIRYRNILSKGVRANLERRDQGYLYSVECSSDAEHFFPLIELELAACLRFAKLCSGKNEQHPIKIHRVSIKHCPMAPVDHYTRVFGCPPTFNSASNSILIDAKSLALSTHNPNPLINQMIEEKLNNLACTKQAQLPFVDRVKAFIANRSNESYPSQEEVAQHFCLSVSGLKGRLKKEGQSFRRLVDENRYAHARRYLVSRDYSVKEVSYRLGFSDQSAFNRAFKRWSGYNPIEFRQRYFDNLLITDLQNETEKQ